MSQYYYILMFNFQRSDMNHASLAAYLRDAVWITKHAVYKDIPNIMFIQSPLLLKPLRERLDNFIANNYLLTATTSNLLEGRMSPDVWEWFNPNPPPRFIENALKIPE